MNEFSETLKYRDILFSAIIPEIKLNQNFDASIKYVFDIVASLKSLDYEKFYLESLNREAGDYLRNVDGQNNQGEHRLKILLRDTPGQTIEGVKTLLEQYRDKAVEMGDSGLWSFQQVKEYRSYLTEIFYLLEKKLNNFFQIYNPGINLSIPATVLEWLEENKFIANKNNKPIMWLKNKQLLRELIRHDKIKKQLTFAEAERQLVALFVDKGGKPIRQLPKNKEEPSKDSDKLDAYLSTL